MASPWHFVGEAKIDRGTFGGADETHQRSPFGVNG
jgi:hypothetical protein